ncbi:MAG TPA: dethiobiotin synthase [Polyangia bacterium]|nr:dethiobiotin synthase [Polyangia bacterium]
MTTPALRGVFVTGTDTGVGKTLVAAGLARLAHRRGIRVVPFKPVETGCAPDAADARLLWSAAKEPVPERDVCLRRFALPAAPAQAAAAQGATIDLEEVVAAARSLAARGELLIVEGAGGLLVPYGDSWTAADLMERLGLPLVVVARTALGTINHTALTIREARRRRLFIKAIVLNRTTADEAPHERDGHRYVAAATGIEPLGPIPWAPGTNDPDRLADLVQRALGGAVDDLLRG